MCEYLYSFSVIISGFPFVDLNRFEKLRAILSSHPWMGEIDGEIFKLFYYQLQIQDLKNPKEDIITTAEQFFTHDCFSNSGSRLFGTTNIKCWKSPLADYMNSIRDDVVKLQEIYNIVRPHYPNFAKRWFEKIDKVPNSTKKKRKNP